MDSRELQTTPKIILGNESLFSAYMVPCDSYTHLSDADDGGSFNQKYVARAASTPLTPEELNIVRDLLRDIFHEQAFKHLRFYSTALWNSWTRHRGLVAPAPQHQDTVRWVPDVSDYANKLTALYFVGDDSAGHRHGYNTCKMGSYIYRLWYSLHRGRPNSQRGHFFAKSLWFHDGEETSWTIPGIMAAHRRLCDATAARFDNEVVHLHRDQSHATCTSNLCPSPAETAQTWREHGLSLHHLFRSVILVADEKVLPAECPLHHLETDDDNESRDLLLWLERLMPERSVLMVRTGDDAHLSHPISFEKLIKEGKTNPLGLEDGKLAEESDVVRVTVGVAVRFLVALQAEEEAAIPRLQQAAATLTEEREEACRAWVESVVRYASSNETGIDGNQFTWDAVRRMWAERDGEIFNRVADEMGLTPLKSWWGKWI
ncbi:hypothetical protein GGR52DRAFT_14164 [Hypoxylon sp. FL1284]|nr:hypothetical protein GGR52DRAFT_14164 [Hypoxylon sp. FL1284]